MVGLSCCIVLFVENYKYCWSAVLQILSKVTAQSQHWQTTNTSESEISALQTDWAGQTVPWWPHRLDCLSLAQCSPGKWLRLERLGLWGHTGPQHCQNWFLISDTNCHHITRTSTTTGLRTSLNAAVNILSLLVDIVSYSCLCNLKPRHVATNGEFLSILMQLN